MDIALYAHYHQRWLGVVDGETAQRSRDQAADLSLADAIALGLQGA